MRYSFRRVIGAALAACALATATAHAEDPATMVVNLSDDATGAAEDAAVDLMAGCTAVIYSWSPVPLTMTPYVRGDSTWYKETGGGIAHANCPATYKVRTRLIDTSAPPFMPYYGGWATATYTGRDPKGVGTNNVPYFGPDAPVLRPYGDITVHVEVYRRIGKTSRYLPVYGGCMEWEYVAQPAAGVSKDLPTSAPCKFDAAFLAIDTAESAGVA